LCSREKETQERRIPCSRNASAHSGGRSGEGARAAPTRTNSDEEPNSTRGSPGTHVPGVRHDEKIPEAGSNGEGGAPEAHKALLVGLHKPLKETVTS